MNYNETIQWFFSQLPMYQRVGQVAYKADLNTTVKLLDALGNPQERFDAIHIAGTNGKGSVSHFVASVMQEAGYKTGLYTSPHLKDFRERIKINGQTVSSGTVVEFVEKNKEILKKIKPSFFEMTVAMAFDFFARKQVDVAVVETGMGGRLDSTNICRPLITAITNISLDHMQFLGDTVEKIAREKAGIIKQKIPVIIGRRQKETTAVFEEMAKSKNAQLVFADDHIELRKVSKGTKFEKYYDLWYDNELFAESLKVPLAGNYQKENIATALQLLLLSDITKRFHIDKKDIVEGIENMVNNTGFKGRWQILSTNPLTIVDTGHNIDGIRAIVAQLHETGYHKLHFILGMVSDKNHSEILNLLPKSARYYFCSPRIQRALDVESLEAIALKAGLKGTSYPSVMHAYHSALNNAGVNDLVFVGGSTFVIAEVI